MGGQAPMAGGQTLHPHPGPPPSQGEGSRCAHLTWFDLVHAGAEWTLRADGITTAIGLPERLQQLLARRLEALPEPTQQLCHRAERGARTAGKVPTR
jgi:hypothetical protein